MRVILAALCLCVASGQGAIAADGASPATRAANQEAARNLPASREDEDFAARGFVAASPQTTLLSASGRVVWDFSDYDFLDGPAPDTVNPALWRHARLLTRHGLFKLHDRLYQVRGFDAANMSIIVGDTGLIIVDPLTSVETAQAALALARATLGEKRVVAVIYTHSHADHFAGVRGVVDAADVARGAVRIIAPEGFLEHAVSENLIAGPAMGRRAAYQFGFALDAGPLGSVTSGIGPRISLGARSLIPPTETISDASDNRIIDGVAFEFQLASDAEAPAEMHFFLPQFGALCLAENANATMHNILTPRGALVRDAKRWADHLTEAHAAFGSRTQMIFLSHAWPRFGGDAARRFMAKHRDAYKFLHDQSVRMMNEGMTGEEIADAIALPESLNDEWYNRGFYGSMSHNSRAVYQRYMGWYDGNPANLDILPKEKTAARYVALMGGAKKLRKAAGAAMDAGDYRWSAELLDKAVFADPDDLKSREMLAESYRQMAYQAESSIWRNMYLSAARELGAESADAAPAEASLDFVAATPSAMLFDLLAVRLDPSRAPAKGVRINFIFTDRNEAIAAELRHGALISTEGALPDADAVVRGPRAAFLAAMFAPGAAPPPRVEGDAASWQTFLNAFSAPAANFNIVTP